MMWLGACYAVELGKVGSEEGRAVNMGRSCSRPTRGWTPNQKVGCGGLLLLQPDPSLSYSPTFCCSQIGGSVAKRVDATPRLPGPSLGYLDEKEATSGASSTKNHSGSLDFVVVAENKAVHSSIPSSHLRHFLLPFFLLPRQSRQIRLSPQPGIASSTNSPRSAKMSTVNGMSAFPLPDGQRAV